MSNQKIFQQFENILTNSTVIGSISSPTEKDSNAYNSLEISKIASEWPKLFESFPNSCRWYNYMSKINTKNLLKMSDVNSANKNKYATVKLEDLNLQLNQTKLDSVKNAQTEDEKYNLISRNLQEVLGEDRIRQVLKTRELKVYWGTATTGRPHIAYFVPMCKIADFLKAGCEVTILCADLHGYLDNMKAPWELLEKRSQYYKIIITEMLKSINVPIDKLKFVKGSDYQLSKEYTLDVYKLTSMVTEHDAKKAGANVVKQVAHPLLSGLLYPLLQGLDEHYLDVDCQFGGVDQRKIFTFSEENMPKLGYKKCSHLMNKMVPGLTGDKMSSSDAASKIDLLDSDKEVSNKIKKAFCEPGNVDNNGVLSFCDAVLFPIYGQFSIERIEQYGGNKTYYNIEELKQDFLDEKCHPGDLKKGVIKAVNGLLKPIRAKFNEKEFLELKYQAYPDTKPVVKAPKKKGAGAAAISPGNLNMRVGLIKKVENHPDSETLFVETVNFGDEIGVRTILSGLVGFVEKEELEGSKRVFLVNLKPRKLAGTLSEGMLLCSSKTTNDVRSVEPLNVPNSANPGDQIVIDSFENEVPVSQLNPKKKIWEKYQPDFVVNDNGEAKFKDHLIRVKGGDVISSSKIRDGGIS